MKTEQQNNDWALTMYKTWCQFWKDMKMSKT